jgi:hypothetical protein
VRRVDHPTQIKTSEPKRPIDCAPARDANRFSHAARIAGFTLGV